MKIIEAMKRIKSNREKIGDLQRKIGQTSAHLSHETPVYDNPALKVSEWAQACDTSLKRTFDCTPRSRGRTLRRIAQFPWTARP